MVVQHVDGGVAEPALGHVDDALEGEVVGRLCDQPQIGQGVADLHALVEARAADHAIGQAERDEAILELAHLERRAHQDRDLVEIVRPAGAVIALELLDLVADRARFLLGIPAGGDLHLLAGHVLGAQRLAEPAFVVRDQVRGGGEDVGGGAVVAFQANDLGAGKVVVEAQDVVDLGAAPAVDRLVVVADAADVFLVERSRGRRLRGRGCRSAPSPRSGERGGVRGDPNSRWIGIPLTRTRFARAPSPRTGRGKTRGAARSHVAIALRRRSATAPATAATDTARRWCPDTRRPGCI